MSETPAMAATTADSCVGAREIRAQRLRIEDLDGPELDAAIEAFDDLADAVLAKPVRSMADILARAEIVRRYDYANSTGGGVTPSITALLDAINELASMTNTEAQP